ncbi:hypothetical protein UFOVP410_16 [uncultured Caudovirales phage]|uniref:Uncharacterized protein n=1 Tax=uncultured Caudovirales phage TaxID=2100421 RepID=A0A6J5M6P9_9CAUD|nr:hypothetical protein UFOVP410_16 [uncultured Caudovirales phage]
MSNFVYDKAKEKFLNGELSWGTSTGGDVFKVMLLTKDYTPNKSTHTNLTHIPQSSRIATSGALTNKSVTSGVASANPITFTNLSLGKVIRSILIIKQNSGATESQTDLIAYIDTATGITTGLPISISTATIEWQLDPQSVLNPPNNKRLIFKL